MLLNLCYLTQLNKLLLLLSTETKNMRALAESISLIQCCRNNCLHTSYSFVDASSLVYGCLKELQNLDRGSKKDAVRNKV